MGYAKSQELDNWYDLGWLVIFFVSTIILIHLTELTIETGLLLKNWFKK